MQAPDVFRNSPLAVQEGKHKGYMNVDAQTLRHKEYNIFLVLVIYLAYPLAKQEGLIKPKQSLFKTIQRPSQKTAHFLYTIMVIQSPQ